MKRIILFLWGVLCIFSVTSCNKEQVVLTIPPKPGGGGPGSIVQNPIAAHTGLNGSLATTPTKPKPTGPSGIVKTVRDSHTAVSGESVISPKTPPMP